MIRRPPRSTQSRSSAASDVYKRQLRDRDRAGHLQELVDGVCGDGQDAVDLRVAGLVRVEPDRVLRAGGEVWRPVRIGQLPGLLVAQQVVVELLGALDERVAPRQVQQEDVLE